MLHESALLTAAPGRVAWTLAAAILLFPVIGTAAESDAAAAPVASAGGYRLAVRDQIEVTVFEEPELGSTQRVDAEGQVRLGLIGNVLLAGRTVREAEDFIQAQYIEQKFLRQPMVTIRILDYAPREAMVNGAVLSPGPFVFPPEAAVVDIVEVITKRGGFRTIARDNAVRVTRFSEKGRETFTVQVRDMLLGRTANHFYVLPGDVIYVDD
jgi:polysaccharide export outer membrane protein